MIRRGLRIATVYDIGAHKGDWSLELKRTVLSDAHFILFEANPEHTTSLQSTGLTNICGIALGDRDHCDVPFYSNGKTGDSYYKEATGWYTDTIPIMLPLMSLNELKRQRKLPYPDFIKIDTQGSELDILNGSTEFISNVSLVYIELPIIAYNQGAPLISAYLERLRELGFIPVAVLEQHILESVLVQIDVMFVNKKVKEIYLGPHHFVRPLKEDQE